MAKYHVELPDGSKYEVEVPDDAQAPHNDLMELAKKSAASAVGAVLPGALGPVAEHILSQEHPGAYLQDKSREGLNKLADLMEPKLTGNRVSDIARGTPQAITRTLADYAPGTLSPEALALEGLTAAKLPSKALNAGGRMLSQVGGMSGATPEALQQVANGELSITGPGADLIGAKLGRKTKNLVRAIKSTFSRDPEEFIAQSEKLADKGVLNPGQAQLAKIESGDLYGTGKITRTAQSDLYHKLQKVAQQNPDLKALNKEYSKAMLRDRIQNLLPIGKKGDVSKLSAGVAAGAGFLNPAKAIMAAPIYSPLTQALIAKTLGAGASAVEPLLESPEVGATLGAVIANKRKKKAK